MKEKFAAGFEKHTKCNKCKKGHLWVICNGRTRHNSPYTNRTFKVIKCDYCKEQTDILTGSCP